MRRSSYQQGVTLIELVVALTVFAVAVAGLVTALPISLFSDAREHNEFVWAARSCAEEIIALEEENPDLSIGNECPDDRDIVDPANWEVEPPHCTEDSSPLEISCEDRSADSYYQIWIEGEGVNDPIILQIPY